ncbi:SEFIR domain-containing protein [Pedobacter panaciterrae]
MDITDKKDLDRILRVLYKESPLAWYKIYTDLEIEKNRADHLFKIGFAFDYLQIEHKGMGEFPTDNYYVGLTNAGFRFFSMASFAETEPGEEHNKTQSFNVYINGSLGGFNLLDIDADQLDIVVQAYLSGNPDFTIAGQKYRPKKFNTLKIFENNSNFNRKELKNLGSERGNKKGFMGKFFSADDLEEFGEELTYGIIGNAQFGSKKELSQAKHFDNKDPLNKPVNSKIDSEALQEKPIFISYSWDTKDHEDHVVSFADELRKNGFNIDIDKIRSQRKTSTNFIQMMHEAFVQSDQIIVVLSEGYKIKADSFEGGVGTEYQLILGEIDKYPNKYIFVSFDGRKDSIIPAGFVGRDIINLSGGLEPLFRKLTGQHEYELSPVSKNKPALTKREIAPFADHQNNIKLKTVLTKSSAELVAKRIEKKKALKKILHHG